VLILFELIDRVIFTDWRPCLQNGLFVLVLN